MRRFMVQLVTKMDFVDGANDLAVQSCANDLAERMQKAAHGFSHRILKDFEVGNILVAEIKGQDTGVGSPPA